MKIKSGGRWRSLEMGRIERILPDPAVVPVPRAPDGVVGLLPYEGQMVPVLRGCEDGSEEKTGRFAVLIREDGGRLRGVLTEEIAERLGSEGEDLDPIY